MDKARILPAQKKNKKVPKSGKKQGLKWFQVLAVGVMLTAPLYLVDIGLLGN